MSNTVNNPTKVITGPNTRWSYCNAWEPKSINGGTPKYSVSLIIPKSDKKTIAKIEAAIEAAYREGEAKLKGNGRSVHSEVYSGVYGRASINFYAFNSNGNKGIACGLNNLQKLRDGEPLGGRSRAEDDFADDGGDDEDFLS